VTVLTKGFEIEELVGLIELGLIGWTTDDIKKAIAIVKEQTGRDYSSILEEQGV